MGGVKQPGAHAPPAVADKCQVAVDDPRPGLADLAARVGDVDGRARHVAVDGLDVAHPLDELLVMLDDVVL